MFEDVDEKNRLNRIKWKRREASFDSILAEYQLKKLKELIVGPNVCDAGCAEGLLTRELSKNYPFVMGIDGCASALEEAQKTDKKGMYICSLLETYTPSILFNSIILNNVLEHVDCPVDLLKHVKEWCFTPGYIIIVVPNAYSMNRRLGKYMGLVKNVHDLVESDLCQGHRRVYDKETLQNDIHHSGLTILEMGGMFLKPLSNPQMVSFDKQILDALYELGKELPDYCALLYAKCRT